MPRFCVCECTREVVRQNKHIENIFKKIEYCDTIVQKHL